jgi:hypothetical protein
MDIGDWVGAVQSGVATIAIIVGAIWGYYKFVRGRTFARRAEPAVAAELLSKGDEHAMRNTATPTRPRAAARTSAVAKT